MKAMCIIFFSGFCFSEREIEMFAIGIRCVRNLDGGRVICHTTVVHAFITME